LAIIQERYTSGLAPPLELLNAEDEDTRARTATVGAEQAYALSVVQLLAAINRLDLLGA
jgi:outer membrane protein TolC